MTEPYEGDPYLQKRYGITKSRFPKWLITAAIVTIVGGAWLAWSANHYSNPEFRSTLISFQEIDSKSIEIRYLVEIKNPKTQLICRLSARDFGLNIVGQIDDPIPLGSTKVTRVVQIPTRLPAVNAQIESCSAD